MPSKVCRQTLRQIWWKSQHETPSKFMAVIIFGQDESVFSQLSFNGMQWVGPSNKRSILPKNDGMGVMVLAFQLREFGWGVEITDKQMVRINQRQIQQTISTKSLPMMFMVVQRRHHLPHHLHSFI
jgi:hypothetical protein